MKVAYVIGGLPFGGVESWLFDLARHLERTKPFEYVIVNVSGTGEKRPEYAQAGLNVRDAGDSKRVLKTHRLDTVLALRRLLGRERPDIVHTLHFSGDYFGRLAALGLGAPVVTHLRNVKRETKGHRRLINKLLSFATDRYLSVSGAVAGTVARDHNLAGRPSQVLYNALDPAKLAGPPLDVRAEFGLTGPCVVGVGRYVAQKNFHLLVEGFRLVLDRCPDACLLLVGEGPERPRLEALIERLGLAGRVALTGYRQDVPAFLKAARVLAMPSDYEGLPVTHLEALFCGVPAVVSDRVPSLEIAAAASLVCERTPESIADQLTALLADDALHARLAASARAIAPAFTMERYVERLLAIYRDMLGQAGEARP